MKATLHGRVVSEPTAPLAEPSLMRIGDVCRWLKISKPTFWRLRREAHFPTPIAITDRVIGWPREEIQSWLEADQLHAECATCLSEGSESQRAEKRPAIRSTPRGIRPSDGRSINRQCAAQVYPKVYPAHFGC